MVNVVEATKYILSLDDSGKYFNKELLTFNNRTFYVGNARLNKILHLANSIYLAMNNGQDLFNVAFYAYDNGAVVPDIQENYSRLLAKKQSNYVSSLPDDIKLFLKKMFFALKDAPIDELIEIDHEDPEWQEKHSHANKSEQLMDTKHHLSDYKERYKDFINILNYMDISL